MQGRFFQGRRGRKRGGGVFWMSGINNVVGDVEGGILSTGGPCSEAGL